MTPPIVRLTVAYGAGLWVGLVVLVPARGIAVLCLVLAGILVFRLPFFAVVALGLATGASASAARAAGCLARWEPGPHSALIKVHDRPSLRGLTTGTVRYAREGGRVREVG